MTKEVGYTRIEPYPVLEAFGIKSRAMEIISC